MLWISRMMLGVVMVTAAACSEQDSQMNGEIAKQQADNALMAVITGNVMYREKMALPPGAEVKVYLEDQSRQDVAATQLAHYTHVVDGAPPYSFRLVYSPDAIDERMRYGLRARIENEGELMFINTEHIDPFASEPGEPVNVVVQRVGSGSR